ncbi:hypothetical protein SHLO109777_05620 [Shewanella loihica]
MPYKSEHMLRIQTANLWSSIFASFLFRRSRERATMEKQR